MKKRAHIIVNGRVQGVGFRIHSVDRAEKLNLVGWVKNRDDGCVEIVAEGEETDVEAFCEWCKIGPKSANVVDARMTYSDATDEFDSFGIRHGQP